MSAPNAGQQTDPLAAYSRLDSGQIPQVAQAFIQRFAGQKNSQAQQFAQLDPNGVSPQQLAQMHQFAAQNQPGILGEVMKHPAITAALGRFAVHELQKHMGNRGV